MTFKSRNLLLFIVFISLQIEPLFSQKLSNQKDIGILFSDGNYNNHLLNAKSGEIIWEHYGFDRSERLEVFENYILQISGSESHSHQGDFLSVHDICNGTLISSVKCNHCFNRFSKPTIWNNYIFALGKNIYSYEIAKNGIIKENSQKKIMKYDADVYNDFKIFSNNLFCLNNTDFFKYDLKEDSLKWQIQISSDDRNHVLFEYNDNILVASDQIIYSINEANGKINWQYKSNYYLKHSVLEVFEFLKTATIEDKIFVANRDKVDIIDLKTGSLLSSINLNINIENLILDDNYLYVTGFEQQKNIQTLIKINLENHEKIYSKPIGKKSIDNILIKGNNIILSEEEYYSQSSFLLINKNDGSIITKRNLPYEIHGLNCINIQKKESGFIWSTIEFDKYIFNKAQLRNIEISEFPFFRIYYKSKTKRKNENKIKEAEWIDQSRISEGVFDFKHPTNISKFILQTDTLNPKQPYINQKIKFTVKPDRLTKIKFNPIDSQIYDDTSQQPSNNNSLPKAEGLGRPKKP